MNIYAWVKLKIHEYGFCWPIAAYGIVLAIKELKKKSNTPQLLAKFLSGAT